MNDFNRNRFLKILDMRYISCSFFWSLFYALNLINKSFIFLLWCCCYMVINLSSCWNPSHDSFSVLKRYSLPFLLFLFNLSCNPLNFFVKYCIFNSNAKTAIEKRHSPSYLYSNAITKNELNIFTFWEQQMTNG